jgi:hypothetical protein
MYYFFLKEQFVCEREKTANISLSMSGILQSMHSPKQAAGQKGELSEKQDTNRGLLNVCSMWQEGGYCYQSVLSGTGSPGLSKTFQDFCNPGKENGSYKISPPNTERSVST